MNWKFNRSKSLADKLSSGACSILSHKHPRSCKNSIMSCHFPHAKLSEVLNHFHINWMLMKETKIR